MRLPIDQWRRRAASRRSTSTARSLPAITIRRSHHRLAGSGNYSRQLPERSLPCAITPDRAAIKEADASSRRMSPNGCPCLRQQSRDDDAMPAYAEHSSGS